MHLTQGKLPYDTNAHTRHTYIVDTRTHVRTHVHTHTHAHFSGGGNGLACTTKGRLAKQAREATAASSRRGWKYQIAVTNRSDTNDDTREKRALTRAKATIGDAVRPAGLKHMGSAR